MMTMTRMCESFIFFPRIIDKLLIDVGINKCILIEVHTVIIKKPHNSCESFSSIYKLRAEIFPSHSKAQKDIVSLE